MLDSNNREIRTGDIVTVSGAYFKSSNGLFFVARGDDAPENYFGSGLWLHRIRKNGELAVESAKSSESWPLSSYCSDSRKNAAARTHNAENARIEITEGVNTWHIAEYFRKKADEYAETAKRERERLNCGEHAEKSEKCAEFFRSAAERLSAAAEQPKQKEPESGVRFLVNGIKVDGGRLISCWYSVDGDEVHISAKDYGGDLPAKYFDVRNDSDIMTDYFEKDRTTLSPGHPLYKYARFVALRNLVNGKDYRKPTEEQKSEFARMRDPGQPTPADYAAIEEMRKAAADAKIAAQEAEAAAERERILRMKNEGKAYIERVMQEHPVVDGEPVVTICWSEHPAFYDWAEDALKMSVAAAEIILKHFDEDQNRTRETPDGHGWYFKTKFRIDFIDATGEPNSYEGRYDLGDNDGGLIEHVRSIGRYGRTHDEKTHQEIENPPQELSDAEKFADWLEQYTDGGRIVSVTVDENVIDLMLYRRKEQKKKLEQARREWDDIMDAVSMLTDEQIEDAIFCISPHDKEKLDVVRFFLQELSRRDEKNALDVFRRWKRGE